MNWSFPRTAALAGAVVIAIETLLLTTGNGAVLHGVLLDPDCYMHLQRALRMMVSGDWHSTFDPRLNAPFGFTIHWTGLFDLMLVWGATALGWLGLDNTSALYIWGSVISPLLLVASLGVFAWGVQRQCKGPAFLWLTVLIFTQPQLSGAFLSGRPDHHSLVLGLMLAQLAWAYRLFDGHTGPRWAMAAGILAGLQLVTSVEALLHILLLIAGLSLAWLFYRRQTMGALALYLAAAVATVVLWLLWERGPYLYLAAYDRVSIAQITALACAGVIFAGLHWLDRRGSVQTLQAKLAALGAGGAAAIAVTAGLYPDFFLGPWPHLDPAIIAWHREISELKPLWPSDPLRAANFLAQLTAPLLAVPLMIWHLLRGPDDDRPLMALSLIGLVLFGGLALFQMRWAGEAQAVTLLPWMLTTAAIMNSSIGIRFGQTHVPLRALILSAALALQMVPSLITQSKAGIDKFTSHPRQTCDWTAATRALPQNLPPRSTVLAPLWYGPEILWRSDLVVVGGPYEIPPAIKDSAAFFSGTAETAHAVVTRRGVSYVVLCVSDTDPGFGQILADGKIPSWLSKRPFIGAPENFQLYQVTR